MMYQGAAEAALPVRLLIITTMVLNNYGPFTSRKSKKEVLTYFNLYATIL